MKTGLTEENYQALSRYRQERAHETLAEIPYLRGQGYYNTLTGTVPQCDKTTSGAPLRGHHLFPEKFGGKG